MRLIDADALIEFCAERWIPLNIDAVNMQPTIQPVATDTNVGDTISRQAAIDVTDSETVSTNPELFKSSEKFIKFMDDDDIASFGRWQWANGFNTALVASKVQLEKLPPAQPEPHEGHWINGKCDLCGEHAPFWAMASTYHESNYCPCCGAKMKGVRT